MRRSSSSWVWLWLVGLLWCCGCANRPRWGFWWGQGTIERQKARAAIHDPYPLNDIGPEVDGGRPREFAYPQPEPARQHVIENQFPGMIVIPPQQ